MGLIDHMHARHNLVVKVASTFPSFTLDMLREIFPYEEDVQHLPDVVAELVESGVLEELPASAADVRVYGVDATTCYRFHSRLLQRQANKLLLDSNRRELEANRNRMAMIKSVRSIMRIQAKTRAWLNALVLASAPAPPTTECKAESAAPIADRAGVTCAQPGTAMLPSTHATTEPSVDDHPVPLIVEPAPGRAPGRTEPVVSQSAPTSPRRGRHSLSRIHLVADGMPSDSGHTASSLQKPLSTAEAPAATYVTPVATSERSPHLHRRDGVRR